MKCRVCNHDMQLGAPIYCAQVLITHPWREKGSNWLRVCESCWLTPVAQGSLTYPLKAYTDWRPPLPCECCGRPIITAFGDRKPVHLRCSVDCDIAMRETARLPKQERVIEQRTCACGRSFTSKRSDAIYCSAACKQRAYRQARAN